MESLKAMQQKHKVVLILGATGTGKSKLSIDLATRIPAEIVNSDKIQVLKGLDIVTNKVTEAEKRGIPHHLLGVLDPEADLTVSDFCVLACRAIETILENDRIPIIVGGSNRYVEALVDNEKFGFRSKYECCFIWLDVATQVHHSYVAKRVDDEMVSSGLVVEVRDVFKPNADYTKGIRQSIGVPELDQYLRLEFEVNEETRKELLKEAIDAIKSNTCKLIHRQLEKIHRLQNQPGWNIRRIDATEVFLKEGKEALVMWEKLVLEPSTKIVEHFLYGTNTGCDDAPDTISVR